MEITHPVSMLLLLLTIIWIPLAYMYLIVSLTLRMMVTTLVAYKPRKISASMVLVIMKHSALWMKHPFMVLIKSLLMYGILSNPLSLESLG